MPTPPPPPPVNLTSITFLVDMSLVTDNYTNPEINGTFNGWCGNCNPLTDQDRINARNALGIALNAEKYAQLAQQEQWPEEAMYITGFRTRTAKDDPSQNVGNFLYGNHIFNTATGTAKPYKK